jgi:hypothetical protein
MIRREDLTRWQHFLGRSAARFYEQRGFYVFSFAVTFAGVVLILVLGRDRLAGAPTDALLQAGATGFVIAVTLGSLSSDPFVSLAGRLYGELEGAGSLGITSSAEAAAGAPAREDLTPADRRMLESARSLGRLGWGWLQGGAAVVVVTSVATVAAAYAGFSSSGADLGPMLLLMAAAGGVGLGIAIGLLILTRWMRLAERLGGAPPP